MRLTPAPLLAVAYVGGALSMWGTLADTAWHRTNACRASISTAKA